MELRFQFVAPAENIAGVLVSPFGDRGDKGPSCRDSLDNLPLLEQCLLQTRSLFVGH